MKFVTYLALYIATAAFTAFAQTSSPTAWCYDSDIRIKVKELGVVKSRSCEWVSRRSTSQRCGLANGAMAAACPVTCGTCTTCVDPTSGLDGIRFRFNKTVDGEVTSIVRSCDWVAREATRNRCYLTGNICRKTCGSCS